MRRAGWSGMAVLVAALGCAVSCAAQDRGLWRSSSATANSITGDIAISETRLTIDLTGFPIAQIRKLDAPEIAALFPSEASGAGKGELYRLDIPAGRRFMHKNSLCGTEETRWMVTYADGRALHVAFLSGANMPVFTFDAMQNSTDLCGTFTYAR